MEQITYVTFAFFAPLREKKTLKLQHRPVSSYAKTDINCQVWNMQLALPLR